MLKFCTNARRAWAGMCQASLSQNPRNAAEDYSKNIAAMVRAGLACPVTPKTEDLVKKNTVVAMARAGLACPDTPKTKDLVQKAPEGGSMGATEVVSFQGAFFFARKKAPAGGSKRRTEVVVFHWKCDQEILGST